MEKKLLRLLLLTLCALAAPMAICQSQATTGVIQGRVTDGGGTALPGATVTLTHEATNFTKVLYSDESGRYRGLLLPLGPYNVKASQQGFTTVVRNGLQLTVGATLTVDITLNVSAVSEEIVVSAANPLIETSRAEAITRIDNASVQGLPNNGRNFLDFLTLTPGVTIVQGPDGDEISINGQKGINNNISLDGSDFNNPFFGEQRGGQRPAFTFNLDAVQEVVVVSEGAPAEFGRSSAGFVNVITKSGTNELGGSAHYFYKNDSLNSRAQNPDGSTADKFDFDQSQVGFTLGGPIVKDRIFYFITFDSQQQTSTKQTDPLRIDPRVVDYFASIGSPLENGPIERTDDAWAFSLKTDFILNEDNQLTLKVNATDSEQVNGTFDVDSWGRSANAIEQDDSHSFSGQLNTVISDSIINEFRVQWAKENRPRPYNGPDIAGQNRPLPDTAFDFGNSYRFGMPFFIPVTYDDTRLQINNNISFIRGSHLIKAGIEYNKTDASQTFIGFANGRFIFSSTDGFLNYTANPLYIECADAAGNITTNTTGVCPVGTDPVGPVLLYLQQAGVGGLTVEEAGTQSLDTTELAVFLQDQWQPRSNLTVQYGLRWETQDNPEVQTPPDQVYFADFIGTTQFGNEFPSDGTIPDDDMLQPRLAITWDPKDDGTSVVRATAGVYYARIPGLALASTRSTNGSIGQTLFRNSALTPILGPTPAYPDLIPASAVGDPFRPDVFVTSKGFRNPRSIIYSLSYERQLTSSLAGLIKGVYIEGDYQTRFINRNDPALAVDPNNVLAPDEGPWSTGLGPGGFNGVGALTSVESTGESRYQAVTLQLTKILAENYQFQLSYTWSEDKSHDDNERDPFTFRYASVTDLEAEYGHSDRDQPHRISGWFIWRAPWDLDFNARYTYRSAQPKSVKADGTDAETPQDRINADGSITERNLGRKDNQFNSLDLRLSKVFKWDRFELEPIFEVFNVFNSKNLLTPEVTNLIFNFDGTVQSGAGSPRQIQLGLKGRW